MAMEYSTSTSASAKAAGYPAYASAMAEGYSTSALTMAASAMATGYSTSASASAPLRRCQRRPPCCPTLPST